MHTSELVLYTINPYMFRLLMTIFRDEKDKNEIDDRIIEVSETVKL